MVFEKGPPLVKRLIGIVCHQGKASVSIKCEGMKTFGSQPLPTPFKYLCTVCFAHANTPLTESKGKILSCKVVRAQ